MAKLLKCNICYDEFEDLGSHPVICLSAGCVTAAYKRGWWELSRDELAKKVKFAEPITAADVKKAKK